MLFGQRVNNKLLTEIEKILRNLRNYNRLPLIRLISVLYLLDQLFNRGLFGKNLRGKLSFL